MACPSFKEDTVFVPVDRVVGNQDFLFMAAMEVVAGIVVENNAVTVCVNAVVADLDRE